MTTLRVAKLVAYKNVKLRASKLTLTGTPTAPKLRVARLTVTGPAPLSLRPVADQTLEPLSAVTLTAMAAGASPTPSSFHWRQISGPTVQFSDGGKSITFTVPPTMTGTSLVFGVVGFLGTASSPEVTATVNPYPHLHWAATGTGWVAQTRGAA